MGKPKKRKKRINTNKPLSERMFVNLVDKIVKRHGKIRIVSSDVKPQCDCLCKECREENESGYDDTLKMRQITRDGNCKVSYEGDGYGRYFSQSCFVENYFDDMNCKCGADDHNNYHHYEDHMECTCEPKKTVKKTMNYLLDHDRSDVWPIELRYGKRFKIKKKIRLKDY